MLNVRGFAGADFHYIEMVKEFQKNVWKHLEYGYHIIGDKKK